MDCVFCRIVAGEEPATILYRNNWSMVIVPLEPVVVGHVIAIPNRHATDFSDDWLTSLEAMSAAFEYARTNMVDYNLITSKGRAATQSVFHLHLHLVPRSEGDGLALPWYSGKKKKN